MAHHDFEVLPNGHLLISAWLRHTFEEAVAAGRDPEKLEDDELWSDHLVEVRLLRLLLPLLLLLSSSCPCCLCHCHCRGRGRRCCLCFCSSCSSSFRELRPDLPLGLRALEPASGYVVVPVQVAPDGKGGGEIVWRWDWWCADPPSPCSSCLLVPVCLYPSPISLLPHPSSDEGSLDRPHAH